MSSIVGIMKQVAEHEAQRIHTTELGLITAVFPHSIEDDQQNYQCSVTLKNRKLPDGRDFELRQVPVATPYIGMVCIPNLNDLVLVNFIGGDINAPIITGRLYNDEDQPPLNKPKEFFLQHSLEEGGSLKIDEQGQIIFTTKNFKNTLSLTDETITIAGDKDKYSIVIDVTGQKIAISSNQNIELTAQNGKITIDAKQIQLKASETFEVQSTDTTLEGTATVAIKSAQVDVK